MANVNSLVTNRITRVVEDIANSEGFEEFDVAYSRGSSDGDNHLSHIIRASITGRRRNSGDTRNSLSLIVKIPLNDPAAKHDSFMEQFFKREVLVYEEMIPSLLECQVGIPREMKLNFAKFYKGFAGNGNELVVFEDVGAKGYVVADRFKSLDYDHLVLSVVTLARFHATSMALKAKNPASYDKLCDFAVRLEDIWHAVKNFLGNNLEAVTDLIKGEPYEKTYEKVLGEILETQAFFFDPTNVRPYDVLSHCDFWIANGLFKYQNSKPVDLIMIDWQLMRNTSPVVDLSCVLLNCLDSGTRMKHYKEMVELYYETLGTCLAAMGADVRQCYPESVYREHLRVYMKFAAYFSVGVFPVIFGDRGKTRNISEVIRPKDWSSSSLSETCRTRFRELFADCLELKIV